MVRTADDDADGVDRCDGGGRNPDDVVVTAADDDECDDDDDADSSAIMPCILNNSVTYVNDNAIIIRISTVYASIEQQHDRANRIRETACLLLLPLPKLPPLVRDDRRCFILDLYSDAFAPQYDIEEIWYRTEMGAVALPLPAALRFFHTKGMCRRRPAAATSHTHSRL